MINLGSEARPYDHVVVGAGSAGAVVAARLSEDAGRRVLLVEAGPDLANAPGIAPEAAVRGTSDATLRHTWGYQADLVPGRSDVYPIGKVLGGSSAINSAVALRGMPRDYDEWKREGAVGWSWQDVLPSFRRLENDLDFAGPVHGDSGPVPIVRSQRSEWTPVNAALHAAAVGMGFEVAEDHNDPEVTGVGPWPMNLRNGARVSTADAYLTAAVRGRPNLDIWADSSVDRVSFDASHHIRSVAVSTPHGEVSVRTREAILCAGAINTPGILLRSGIGRAADVRQAGGVPFVELAGVGDNLQDHPFVPLYVVPEPGICDLPVRSVQVGVRYTADKSSEQNDMQLLAAVPVDVTPNPELHRRIGADTVFMIGTGLQRPQARGRVTWTPTGPHIDLRFGSTESDLNRVREGLRIAWRLMASTHLKRLSKRVAILDERDMSDHRALDAYLREHWLSFKHATGTARMGSASDPMVVLDPQCRVLGVEGLRVADASIMPTIPSANINLTCIMIGEHVSDLIRRGGPTSVFAPRAAAFGDYQHVPGPAAPDEG